jgi:glycosyltransferase involved in cell wall biosynthesis
LLSRAAFLVMPSRFEASPLVLVEAFCYQLPVVLFAIPELAELPETCCVKAPAFNTKELGQAMLALSQDPGRRQALGLASKELARNFDWDDLAAAYEDFLNYVVRGPIRRRHR